MFEAAYLVFQTEVGIGGSILDILGCLATHSFFQNLWQILLWYGITLHLPNTTVIPLSHEDDQPMMDVIDIAGILTTKELVEITRFCRWKKVHSIGNLVMCDGLTVRPSMVTRTEGTSTMDFPHQQPTSLWYEVWKHTIGSLTISGMRLCHPLGPYIAASHQEGSLYTNRDSTQIYQRLLTGKYEVYDRPQTGQSTRFGSIYILSDTIAQGLIPMHEASVHSWNG